jgi:hypothetical protein
MNMDIIIGTLMVMSSLPMGMVPSFSWAACFLFSAGISAIVISPVGGSGAPFCPDPDAEILFCFRKPDGG